MSSIRAVSYVPEESPMVKLSEQGVIVYKAMIDEMSFLKKQQWTITNYLVLIYGAIFGLWNIKPVPDIKWLLILSVSGAALFGAWLLCLIQYDLGKARERIQEVDHKIFDADERSVLKIGKYQGPHLRGFSFLLVFILIDLCGAILLICSLSH
jgi:hypothetical protein